MKKKWQEVKKCNFAIKVSFMENCIKFTLYDRNDRKLFLASHRYPCTPEVYNSCVNKCYECANEQGNNDEWIYVHNPYEMRCKDILI